MDEGDMLGETNLDAHFNEMVDVLKHKTSRTIESTESKKTEKISKHMNKVNIIDKQVNSEILKTKGLSKISLSDRIDDYAVFISESSETRPILKWLQEIALKVRRFFGISPGKAERSQSRSLDAGDGSHSSCQPQPRQCHRNAPQPCLGSTSGH